MAQLCVYARVCVSLPDFCNFRSSFPDNTSDEFIWHRHFMGLLGGLRPVVVSASRECSQSWNKRRGGGRKQHQLVPQHWHYVQIDIAAGPCLAFMPAWLSDSIAERELDIFSKNVNLRYLDGTKITTAQKILARLQAQLYLCIYPEWPHSDQYGNKVGSRDLLCIRAN